MPVSKLSNPYICADIYIHSNDILPSLTSQSRLQSRLVAETGHAPLLSQAQPKTGWARWLGQGLRIGHWPGEWKGFVKGVRMKMGVPMV